MIRIIKETNAELDVERQNPKIKRPAKDQSGRRTAMLVENYIRGPPLALELDDFLREIFRALHQKYMYEEMFEVDKSKDDDDSSEVPMEIVDDE